MKNTDNKMDNNAEKLKTFFQERGLYNGRDFLTRKEFQQLVPIILSNQETHINLTKIIGGYNDIIKQKKAIVNQNFDKILLQDSTIYLRNEFAKLCKQYLEYDKEISKLEGESKELEEHGFVQIAKVDTFYDYRRKFDENFSSIGFDRTLLSVLNKTKIIECKNQKELLSKDELKKVKIKIIDKLFDIPSTKFTHYEHEKIDNYGNYRRFFVYDYELLELNNTISITDSSRSGFDGDEEPVKIPLQKLVANFGKNKCEYYAYEAEILLEDYKMPVYVVSYNDLRSSIYICYGYLRGSSNTVGKTFELVDYEPDILLYSSIDDICLNKDKHNFINLYEFILKHVKKFNTPINKKQSDAIVWIEILKTIVQFSGFDESRRTHSFYVGFQDVGKTYVTDIFRKVKFSNSVKITDTTFSIPGLTGASNQTIRLPDRKIENVGTKGAFARDAIIFAEVGKAIANQDSLFGSLEETFKELLHSRTYSIHKTGSNKNNDRNAYITMIMNYNKEWKENLRRKFEKFLFYYEKEYEQGKFLLGEDKSHNMLEEFEKPKSHNLAFLCKTQDLLLNINDYPEQEFRIEDRIINEYEAKLFKAAMKEFRNQNVDKDRYTGLNYSLMKRFLFNLFGTTQETKDDGGSETVSEIEAEDDLYIPNLKQIIEEHIQSFYKTLTDKDLKEFEKEYDLVFEHLYYKYKNLSNIGSGTIKVTMIKILKSITFFNEEKLPSYFTYQLLEKWAYLQCNAITTKEAKSFVQLEKRINYTTKEEYEKLLERKLK